jgi:hypothetical protein
MPVRKFSLRAGSLINASKHAPLVEKQRALVSSETASGSGGNRSPTPWQHGVLCYDYRHSERYGLPGVNLFTSEGDADPGALVHCEASAVNDLHLNPYE